MHLTKISGRAIKGGDFDIALAQANVITGDNFAGKTRIIDAIRLLLVGYLPELGKTNQDTFGLASGPVMSVRGEFSDGTVLERRWTSKGDSVQKSVEPPRALEAEAPMLSVMLNADEYFAISDQARVNYVFAHCAIDGAMTRETIAERIHGVAPDFGFSKLMELSDDPLQEWIAQTIEAIADEWTAAKQNAKRMEETVRGLTALRSADAQARPLAVAEDERTALNLKISELKDRHGQLSSRFMAMHAAQLRRQAIVRELSAVDKTRSDRATAENKLDMLTREMAGMIMPAKSIVDLSGELQAARQKMETAAQAIERHAEAHRIQEKALAQLDHTDICPFCGAKGEGWKALRAAELATEIDLIQAAQVTALQDFNRSRESVAAAEKQLTTAKEAQKRYDDAKTNEANLRYFISQSGTLLARAQALEEERDRLVEYNAHVEADVTSLKTQVTVAEGQQRTLDQEIKTAIGRQHDLKRLADAEKQRDKALKDQADAAAAGKEMRTVQAELVASAFAPMLEMANRIASGVLKSPLAYRDGEIGTYRASGWIGHRTMSGTEKLLTYTAIQAALAAKSPIRIMIADELGRLTVRNATRTAIAAQHAIEGGLIDQFIGIDPERPELYRGLLTAQAFNIVEIK